MTFGQRLKATRAERGISQRELAQRIDISYAAIRWYESDQHAPSAATLERLADALGMTMQGLWKGEGGAASRVAGQSVSPAVRCNVCLAEAPDEVMRRQPCLARLQNGPRCPGSYE